jgi:hypothetical protein
MYSMQASAHIDFFMKSMRLQTPSVTDDILLEAFKQSLELKERQLFLKRNRSSTEDSVDGSLGGFSTDANVSDVPAAKKPKISDTQSKHIHFTKLSTTPTDHHFPSKNPFDAPRSCPAANVNSSSGGPISKDVISFQLGDEVSSTSAIMEASYSGNLDNSFADDFKVMVSDCMEGTLEYWLRKYLDEDSEE